MSSTNTVRCPVPPQLGVTVQYIQSKVSSTYTVWCAVPTLYRVQYLPTFYGVQYLPIQYGVQYIQIHINLLICNIQLQLFTLKPFYHVQSIVIKTHQGISVYRYTTFLS